MSILCFFSRGQVRDQNPGCLAWLLVEKDAIRAAESSNAKIQEAAVSSQVSEGNVRYFATDCLLLNGEF
jgi:hypothetical protein